MGESKSPAGMSQSDGRPVGWREQCGLTLLPALEYVFALESEGLSFIFLLLLEAHTALLRGLLL